MRIYGISLAALAPCWRGRAAPNTPESRSAPKRTPTTQQVLQIDNAKLARQLKVADVAVNETERFDEGPRHAGLQPQQDFVGHRVCLARRRRREDRNRHRSVAPVGAAWQGNPHHPGRGAERGCNVFQARVREGEKTR